VVVHLEVRHLVLHDVVEDLGGAQQQAVVEAHRALRGARRPPRSLASDGEAPVRGAGPGDGGVEPGAHLQTGSAAVPALDGVAEGLVAERHVQRALATGDVGAHALGLPAHVERQPLAEVRDLAAVLEPRRRERLACRLDASQGALDPGPLLAH